MNHASNSIGLRSASVTAAAKAILPHGVALLCALSTIGCLAPEGDAEETVGDVQQEAFTNNALTNNALTNNALTNNALTNNALTNNALTNNALTSGALINALTDPNARAVLKYIVSCALPAGKQVDVSVAGVSYSYPGELGLAPQWALNGGTCNTSCQEWISACVMARVDYLGEKVLISMRGENSALTPSNSEIATYKAREGAYYGNIFLPVPERNACIAPGRSGLPRVCGPSLTNCAVDAVGYCDDVCDDTNNRDGSFSNCHDNVRSFYYFYPWGTKKYAATATVFLVGP